MRYNNIVEARFIERPNRFIAYCEVDGERVKAHVRNTGRLRELLLPGVRVYLEKSADEKRKTASSLITVEKNIRESIHFVNIDSTAPNKVLKEALSDGSLMLPGLGRLTHIKPESTFGDSRFDFYLESMEQKAFVEVKGVTLEKEGAALFPDAPTERGLKHIEELIKVKKSGHRAYAIFLVQMTGVEFFSPNNIMHPAFGAALKKAEKCGVSVLCYDCDVTPDSLKLKGSVPVRL